MIVCPYCQGRNADAAGCCTRCGQLIGHAAGPPAGFAPTGQARNAGLAITALIAGLLSMVGCLGVGSLVAIITGAMAMSRASREPHVYGGRGMALAGVLLGSVSLVLFIFGVMAAITIPKLLRDKVAANEVATIGDTRTVISAQVAYADANGGAYDTLSCLAAPASCIPDYNGTPTMLMSELASGAAKSGYRRTLHLGPRPPELTPAMSPSSVASFAYVSVPVERGRTGARAFCGDARGVLCYTADGREPEVVNGECQVGDRCVALP